MLKEVALFIPSFDDRRTLAGILADNGYSVRVYERKTGVMSVEHWLCIDLSETNQKSGNEPGIDVADIEEAAHGTTT